MTLSSADQFRYIRTVFAGNIYKVMMPLRNGLVKDKGIGHREKHMRDVREILTFS